VTSSLGDGPVPDRLGGRLRRGAVGNHGEAGRSDHRVHDHQPLAAGPRVTFTQPGRAGVTVIATRLADGSYRAVFTVQSGAAGAGSVKVSAKDSGGRYNTTTLRITVAS
jgi:hypothetical protein